MNSFYSKDELLSMNFKALGSNVKISKKSSIYGAAKIEIGNNVRIDDFVILSGKIKLQNYIHIAAYSALFAGDVGIVMDDYSTISSKVSVYAVSDDYSGNFMTNPTVPEIFTNVHCEEVYLGKHVIVGSGSTILPGVRVNNGVAVGSMSLVNKNLEEWKIYVGVPARLLKSRKRDLLKYESHIQ